MASHWGHEVRGCTHCCRRKQQVHKVLQNTSRRMFFFHCIFLEMWNGSALWEMWVLRLLFFWTRRMLLVSGGHWNFSVVDKTVLKMEAACMHEQCALKQWHNSLDKISETWHTNGFFLFFQTNNDFLSPSHLTAHSPRVSPKPFFRISPVAILGKKQQTLESESNSSRASWRQERHTKHAQQQTVFSSWNLKKPCEDHTENQFSM